MTESAKHSSVEVLRDGRRIEIRALSPDDRTEFLAAVSRVAPASLYRRFLGPKRSFTDKEVAFFSNVDFADHVAIIAVTKEAGREVIMGGGRYIVVQSGQAEVAFTVIDQYHGLGIGTALLSNLAAIARNAGIRELIADVLPDNISMLAVFKKSGFPLTTKRELGVVHVTLRLS